jgi:hypothetical protein
LERILRTFHSFLDSGTHNTIWSSGQLESRPLRRVHKNPMSVVFPQSVSGICVHTGLRGCRRRPMFDRDLDLASTRITKSEKQVCAEWGCPCRNNPNSLASFPFPLFHPFMEPHLVLHFLILMRVIPRDRYRFLLIVICPL